MAFILVHCYDLVFLNFAVINLLPQLFDLFIFRFLQALQLAYLLLELLNFLIVASKWGWSRSEGKKLLLKELVFLFCNL